MKKFPGRLVSRPDRPFLELWERSLALRDAERAQRFVEEGFGTVAQECGFGFWSGSGPLPRTTAIYVSIGTYDRNAMAFLDTLLERAAEIVVFPLDEIHSISQLQVAIPDGERFVADTVIAAEWRDGAVVETVRRSEAREWFLAR